MKKLTLASGLALALSPAVAFAGGEIVAPAPLPPAPVPVAAPAPAPVLAPAPVPVAERAGGPYVALYGGATWLDDADLDVTGLRTGEVEFDTGYVVGGAVGYGFDAGFVRPRAELDVSYRESDLDEAKFGSLPSSGASGDISAVTGLANVWLDFPVNIPVAGAITPYVGGGVGAAEVEINDGEFGFASIDGDDHVFAWQLGAGVAYEFTPSWAATVDYRWFNTDDPGFSGAADADIEYESHNVMAGLRYTF